jgi:hypothetical protein
MAIGNVKNTVPDAAPSGASLMRARGRAGKGKGDSPRNKAAGSGESKAIGNPSGAPISRIGEDTGGGGGGGGGLGGIDIGTLPPLSDQDYLAGDAQYQAQLAALMDALNQGNTDFEAQSSRYQTTFDDSLRQLGWGGERADDPATADVNEAQPGSWNRTDQNTASGRALNNQLNDFASRGMLQSSLFGTANDNLMRSLNEQLGSMQTGRQGFMDDIARQRAAFEQENLLNQQNAKAEALARRAAGIF